MDAHAEIERLKALVAASECRTDRLMRMLTGLPGSMSVKRRKQWHYESKSQN